MRKDLQPVMHQYGHFGAQASGRTKSANPFDSARQAAGR